MTKTITIIGWLITAVLILFIAGLAFIRFSPGYNFSVVRSGSMTPTFRMGDVIITRPLEGSIEPGMIIMYERDGETISHRVLSVDGDTLTMKGDALDNPDPWQVSVSAVRGTYIFKIPWIGYAVSFIKTKLGWFLTIILPATLMIIGFILNILRETFSEKQKSLNSIEVVTDTRQNKV